MRRIIELFNRVMIEVTKSDRTSLPSSIPVVRIERTFFVEFEAFINHMSSPHLSLEVQGFNNARSVISAKITSSFTNKSADALRDMGFTDYTIVPDVNTQTKTALYLDINMIPADERDQLEWDNVEI